MGNQAVRATGRESLARPFVIPGGLILLAASPSPASAAPPPLTAEQAIAAQKDALRSVILPRCRPDAEEIVVCGRRADRERVPFPDQHLPGDRTHLLPGEAPNGVTALARADPPCNSAGAPRCGFSISFITVGIVLFKVGKHVIDPDSDPPPTPIGAEVTPP
jgi:hypothetical protein